MFHKAGCPRQRHTRRRHIPRVFLPCAMAAGIAVVHTVGMRLWCADMGQDGAGPLAHVSARELLKDVAADPALERPRNEFIAAAQSDAVQPVRRRARSIAQLREWGIPLKYDVRPPHMSSLPDKEWEIFCLSQADNAAGAALKVELPRLAAAAVLTDDDALMSRMLAQLEELATWSPLERRGWSLKNSTPRFSGDDGAWLGTGWLVRAIVDATDLLPVKKMPPDLLAALKARLAAELLLMRRDWAERRPWYAKSEAAHSNQWILPNEALVRACLFLGVDEHRETYEGGVARLLRSMDAQGVDGEFVEGLRYSGLSLESLYSIARATARAGDRRLLSHPLLVRFPTWLVHHFQPGGFLINAFDSPGSSVGNLSRDRDLLATAAVVSTNPHALWGLRTRAGFGDTLDAIFAASMPFRALGEPPLFAAYTKAPRLNWRSSWDDKTATGLWVRGGHVTDFHDHMDRGHVNFVIGKRALLIEAGTLNYGVPQDPTHMRSVAGHNVLQIGGSPPEKLTREALQRAGQILRGRHREAPITVERVDERGGAARIDLSGCYAIVSKWRRRVAWDCLAVTVEDEVELREPDVVQFRWHLGVSPDDGTQVGPGRVLAGGVSVVYTAEPHLAAHVESMPDATLARNQLSQHACVVLRSAGPVQTLKSTTRVSLVPDDAKSPH